MSINIGPPSVEELRPRISVIGVGGAGGNAVANMIGSDIEGVDFVVANTDAQALNNSIAEHRIQLGPEITRGLGAGSRPEVGRAAAEETVEEIERALEGVNMVFVAAGMGGGTGTGAAPVIAEVARSRGILTIGVVTKPFLFEGTRRMRSAEAGIEELQKHVDTLIVIPNQNLFLVAKAETTFKEAFMLADEVLQMGVRSITDLMVMPGLINLDFADIRSVMNEMGKAMMGTGEGEGENRALEAAEKAIANPLLEGVSMTGAKGVIISIIGGEDMKLLEVDEAANHIRELVDPDANIIWGSAFNPDLQGRIRVSVVATGIEASAEQKRPVSQSFGLSSARGPKRPVLATVAAAKTRTAPVDAEEETRPKTAERAAPSEPPAEVDEEIAPMEEGPVARPRRVEPVAASDDNPNDEAASGEIQAPLPDPADDSDFAEPPGHGFAAAGEAQDEAARDETEDDEEAEEEPFELTRELEQAPAAVAPAASAEREPADAAKDAVQDQLLLDEERMAETDERAPMEEVPARRAGAGRSRPRIVGARAANEDGADQQSRSKKASAASGTTLFERMANMTRNSAAAEDEDEEEDGGAAVRIPRFLGRQNNQ